jgi:hypothetical protein
VSINAKPPLIDSEWKKQILGIHRRTSIVPFGDGGSGDFSTPERGLVDVIISLETSMEIMAPLRNNQLR